MASYFPSKLPEAKGLQSGADNLFAAENYEFGKVHLRHGTESEDTESTSTIPTDSKDGLFWNGHDTKYHRDHQQDTDDFSPHGNKTSTTICCLIISAILIYTLGELRGRSLLDLNDDPSWTLYEVAGTRRLRALKRLPEVTLGAYYYPWHGGGDFHGGRYLREHLGQQPLLGEYNDRDPKVIAQHLEWSQRANIKLWVTSWWGPHSPEDKTTRESILTHPDLLHSNHKISLFYETLGRIVESEAYSLHRVRPDMEFMCATYFRHPNYFHIDGKPVVYMYLTRLLEDLGYLPEVIRLMRQSARDACGKEIYIIGDHIFGPPVSSAVEEAHVAFKMLDGVTTYDNYGSIGSSVGSMGGYLREADVRRYYETEQSEWRNIVKEKDCAFIPSVSPGYNDLAVRPEAKHIPLSRSLRGEGPGSLFQTAVASARTLVDSSASNVLMVNSFNEWHEDSQIEPVAGKSTSEPFDLTHGLTYHGYGTLYLDILRSATSNHDSGDYDSDDW